MKILHTVQLYHPAVGGSEEVVKQLSERLVKRGHKVTVATAYLPEREKRLINGVRIKEFHISRNLVRGIDADKKEIKRFQKFILEGGFDVIMNYAAQIWSSDLIFPLLDKIKARKIFVPCGYSALQNPEYKQYFKDMPRILRKYDLSVYLSDTYQDKLFAKKHNISNTVTIPNAANEDEFLHDKPSIDFKQKYNICNKFLLTVANHYKIKGHNFVIEAYKASKTPNLDLVIIGDPAGKGCFLRCKRNAFITELLSFGKKKTHILSKVPRPYVVSAFKQAAIFVFGSEVECSPLVLFEAMAAKLPFISTDCGNSKELAGLSYNIIVTTPKQMASQIDRLLSNKQKYGRIANYAFKVWKRNFTWEKITDGYEKIYQE